MICVSYLPHCSVVTGAFSLGLKHAGLEADYLPLSCRGIWCYTSIPALCVVGKLYLSLLNFT